MTTNTEVRYLFFYVFIGVVLFRHNLTRTCKRGARNPFFGGRGYVVRGIFMFARGGGGGVGVEGLLLHEL